MMNQEIIDWIEATFDRLDNLGQLLSDIEQYVTSESEEDYEAYVASIYSHLHQVWSHLKSYGEQQE